MTNQMSTTAWQHLEQMAKRDGLDDAQLAGLAIGCPQHGNASMDYDDDGVFCHRCEAGQ
jgi:hypothetical protein